MISVLIVLAMAYMHIIDDYCLQGVLANLKQKSWWLKNVPDPKCWDDWGIALCMHAMSWSVSISLPIIVYGMYTGNHAKVVGVLCLLPVNFIVHALVDHLKCNMHKINLWIDQTIHLFQIACTAGACSAL